jgi:hypothetical protein
MGCSIPGLTAIVVVGIAAVFNIVSFSLPMWSTSAISEAHNETQFSASFSAGLWGYCADVTVSNKTKDVTANDVFNHCFLFHTSSKFDTKVLENKDPALADKLSGHSLCDGMDKAERVGTIGRKAYTTALAVIAKINPTAFDAFLVRSCSFLGTFEILLAVVGSITGVATFVLLVLGVTFFKNESRFNGLVKGLVIATCVIEFFTFVFWLVQSHAVNKLDSVGLSGSFVLSVLATLMFGASIYLVQRHLTERARAGYNAV